MNCNLSNLTIGINKKVAFGVNIIFLWMDEMNRRYWMLLLIGYYSSMNKSIWKKLIKLVISISYRTSIKDINYWNKQNYLNKEKLSNFYKRRIKKRNKWSQYLSLIFLRNRKSVNKQKRKDFRKLIRKIKETSI